MRLSELEDQWWFPPILRRMQMEYIGWLAELLHIYQPIAPVLKECLRRAGQSNVVDLASGSGGPANDIAEHIGLPILLTDLYPANTLPRATNVCWHPQPVDALDKSQLPEGFYIMFNAFHHFDEKEKTQLIRSLGGAGFLVAELLQPRLPDFLKILVITTIGQVLLCPFIRPFRWERLLFTWILPINLLTVAIDGLISVLRVDPFSEMVERAEREAPPGTEVQSGHSGPFWARVHWFCVLPGDSGV